MSPLPAGRPLPRRRQAGGSSVLRRGLTVIAAATGVGLLTGFFGVGGGFVIVPALVLVLGFDMPAAVGTSLLVIAINSARRSPPGWAATSAWTGHLAGMLQPSGSRCSVTAHSQVTCG